MSETNEALLFEERPVELSDEFWKLVEPHIPQTKRNQKKQYKRKPGAGRKSLPPRLVLEGMLHVLRTGIRWKDLPKERYGSPSAVHRYFLAWTNAGLFKKLWKNGLAEYDEMAGIAWTWQVRRLEEIRDEEDEAASGSIVEKSRKRRVWLPFVARRRRLPARKLQLEESSAIGA